MGFAYDWFRMILGVIDMILFEFGGVLEENHEEEIMVFQRRCCPKFSKLMFLF